MTPLAAESCPRCETWRVGDYPFCENCGHRFGSEDDVGKRRGPDREVVIRSIGSTTTDAARRRRVPAELCTAWCN